MATNVAGMQFEGTTVSQSATKGVRTPGQMIVIIGIAVALTAVILASVAMHGRGTSHPAGSLTSRGPVNAAQYYDDLMAQQDDLIHTMAARATMRRAAEQSDALMAQQEDFIHTMAARADTRSVTATTEVMIP